jgi:O-antigen/teichoic acid export membrane protein
MESPGKEFPSRKSSDSQAVPSIQEISLTQNAGLVGISKLVNIFGLLVASMVLTRLLSRSEYGNYEQVWLVYNSFLPMVAYGLSSAIYFFSAREDKRSVYSAAVAGTSIVGIFAGIVLAVLAPVISRLFNAGSLTSYIQIMAVYTVISSSSMMFEAVFVTEKKVKLLLLGNAIVAVMFAVMVSLSAIEFHSLTFVFISITIVGAVKSIYLFSFLIKSGNLTTHRLSPVMKAQFYYALPIFISTITGMISKQIDKYLVTLFYSPDQFAIYAIGSKEIPLIAVITGSASAVLFPVFSDLGFQEMREKFVEVWKNSISKTGLFLLPIMVFLLFAANDFMYFFFGQKYVASSGIFRVFLLLIPLRLAFYSQALLSIGKQKLYMFTALGELVFSGLASYFLLTRFGLEGAAIGKVAVTFLEVIVLVAALLAFLKTDIKEFFPWIKIMKIIGLSTIALLPILFVRSYIENVYVRFLIEGTMFVSVYAAAAILTKSVRIINARKLQFVVN